MSVQNATAAAPVVPPSVLREYRLSLALLVAGIVLIGVTLAVNAWVSSSADQSSFSWAGLLAQVGETAGGVLILLAGTVAYYHRSFIRQNSPPT